MLFLSFGNNKQMLQKRLHITTMLFCVFHEYFFKKSLVFVIGNGTDELVLNPYMQRNVLGVAINHCCLKEQEFEESTCKVKKVN